MLPRALEVNREGQKLLRQFRDDAKTRVVTGQVPQQDLLQADLEIGQQRERETTLGRLLEVAIARINTLLHLPPDSPLPPPSKDVGAAEAVPETAALRQDALARRPDLKALADRIAAAQAALALAEREYKPDFDVMGSYDTFWQEKPLRAQLGVRVNLPLRQTRRDAAVAEARALLVQRQAEYARQADLVAFQVHDAAAQVRESQRIVRLYDADLLPTARLTVKTFRAEFVTGKVPLWRLVGSQRDLVNLQDRYYDAIAAAGRRLAALKRVIGAAIVEADRAPAPPQSSVPPADSAVPQVLPPVTIRP